MGGRFCALRAGRALRHFTRYLRKRPSGTLAKEALYGKARALRALGRRQAEIKALKSFVRRYPSSIYADRARARLKRIEKTP